MRDLMKHTRELQFAAFNQLPQDPVDVEWARHMVLGIVREAMEVLDEIPNWKEWRETGTTFSVDRYVEELIDVVHFAAALTSMTGITDEEWERRYLEKSSKVAERRGCLPGLFG